MEEQWRDIQGHEGYQVSDLGRIRKITYIKSDNCTPYARVILQKEYKKSYNYVHRLVAQAFIPNPENKPMVNHKDLNKSNNKLDNLEWNTPTENNVHSTKAGVGIAFRKFSDDQAREIRAKYADGAKPAHLAKEYGVSFQTMHSICKFGTYKDVI